MGPCVWLIGQCEKKKEEKFRKIVQSRGIPLARCRNLDDMVKHLSGAHYPTFLVCGSDIKDLWDPSEPYLPALRVDDPRTVLYLKTYADSEVWCKVVTPPPKRSKVRTGSAASRGSRGKDARKSTLK